MIRYYGNTTFMLCMPRSRSAWMCEFLGGVAHTMHDPLKNCASIDELGEKIDEILILDHEQPIFIADTAALFFVDQIRARFPGARYMVVHRPRQDVHASLERFVGGRMPASAVGLLAEEDERMQRAVQMLSAQREFMCVVEYDAINDYLRNIYRFVGGLGALLDEYLTYIVGTNIQIPHEEQMRNANPAKFSKLFASRSKLT